MLKRILILFFLIQSAYGESLKIGLFELYPYVYNTKKGPQGVIINFLNQIQKESEIKFVYHVTPYPRLIKSIKTDHVDVGILYPNSKAGIDRYKEFPTLGNQNYLVSFKHKVFNKKDKTKKIGVIRGASYCPYVDGYPEKMKIKLKSYEQGLKMVGAGRLDYLMIPSTVLYSLCSEDMCGKTKLNLIHSMNTKNNWIHASSHTSKRKVELFKQAHDKVLKKHNYNYLHDLID